MSNTNSKVPAELSFIVETVNNAALAIDQLRQDVASLKGAKVAKAPAKAPVPMDDEPSDTYSPTPDSDLTGKALDEACARIQWVRHGVDEYGMVYMSTRGGMRVYWEDGKTTPLTREYKRVTASDVDPVVKAMFKRHLRMRRMVA